MLVVTGGAAEHEVVRAEGPERIAPEWWRERSTARLRDYYRIEDGQGRLWVATLPTYPLWRPGGATKIHVALPG